MDKLDCNNTIYETLNNIKFALSNLACIRISIKGNEDVIPNPETIEEALYTIENLIEEKLDIIYKTLDKLNELETVCNEEIAEDNDKSIIKYKDLISTRIQDCNDLHRIKTIYAYINSLLN